MTFRIRDSKLGIIHATVYADSREDAAKRAEAKGIDTSPEKVRIEQVWDEE